MSEERLVEVELDWSLGYLGKSYGPGKVKVPEGLARQIGQYDPNKADEPPEPVKGERELELERENADLKVRLAEAEKSQLQKSEQVMGTPLPDPFVNAKVRQLLIENGFSTVELVAGADDERLLALDGIADASLKAIKDALPKE